MVLIEMYSELPIQDDVERKGDRERAIPAVDEDRRTDAARSAENLLLVDCLAWRQAHA